MEGSSIFVTDDVSKATQEIRRSKMGELLEKRRQGIIAYFSGTKIVTKDPIQSERKAETDTNREPNDVPLRPTANEQERVVEQAKKRGRPKKNSS